MNITGKFYGYDAGYVNNLRGDGTLFVGSGNAGRQSSSNGDARDANYIITFDASRAWSGSTTEDSFTFGNGQAHNNMQPYRTAICWHRTA